MNNILLLITIIGTVFASNAQVPSAPTYAGTTTICTGQNTTITAQGEAGATFTWWDAPTGGTLIQNGAVYTTPTFGTAGTYYYYVDQTVGGFTSATRTEVVITVNQTPTVVPTATPAVICEGGSSVLSATGADTYTWNPGGLTGSPTVSPTSNQNYTVVGTTNGCNSAGVAVLVTVQTISNVANQTICSGNSATLTTNNADTYVWTPGGMTGNSTVVSPLTTTVYSVTGTFTATGCTSTRTSTVTVNPTPPTPTVTPNFSVASGSHAYLSASSAGATSYSWSTNFGNYGSLTGSDVTVVPASTTTYSVVASALGCNSPAGTVIVTVNDLADITGDVNICDGTNTALTATGTGPFTWYNAASGGSLLFTGAVYTTPTLSTPTSYWVSANGGPRKEVRVNVITAPTNVLASETTICNGNTSFLSADILSGQINWYTVPSGGSAFANSLSGNSIVVSPITTTTYYAEGSTTEEIVTFNYTGGAQTWTVPEGVYSILVDAKGARGGGAHENLGSYGGKPGGNGGRVLTTLAVTPGQILNIYVGGRGYGDPACYPCSPPPAGWNGGGAVNNDASAGSGGGASDIRINGTSLTDRIIVAGAGGGGAAGDYWTGAGGNGGHGGGLIGQNGTTGGSIGQGGSQNGGANGGGQNSRFGFGGNSGSYYGNYGGAGGGGWFGGSGATNRMGAGGGSSYTSDSLCQNVIHTQGYHNGNGQVIITYSKNCTTSRVPVTVTVINDVVAPVADIASLPTVTDECAATVVDTPTSTDFCVGAVTGTTTDPLTYTTEGNHTITWLYDDGNGNISTQTQTVIIDDITAPVPDLATLADINGECEVNSLTLPSATDNCSGTITITNDAVFPISGEGTTTVVTWTFDDGRGNISTQTQNVIIDDITAPVPDLPALVAITDECAVASITAPTATDNCSGIITGVPDVTFPITTQGTTTITWTYDDGKGNISTQIQEVTINDVSAPVEDSPVLMDVTDPCAVASIAAPTAFDNCAGALTAVPDVIFPIEGSTVVTWTFDDGNGNITTQTQNVIISNTVAPTPDIATLTDVTDPCSIVSLTPPTATDDCGGTVSVSNDAVLPISNQGTTVVTWTYTDGNGNESTQTQNVVIADVTAPVEDIAVLADVIDPCSVSSIIAPTATDACSGILTGTPDVVFPITASSVITWTFDDGHGNITTQTQNVIIDDAIAPVEDIATLTDVSDQCEVAFISAPTATDNCSGLIVGTPDVTFPITDQGTTIITWSYEDANGNIATQTQNVIIADVYAPIVDVASLETLVDCNEVTPLTPTATDNCSGLLQGSPDVVFPITNPGTTIVTWTFDDGNGNMSTQTQNVTITDIETYVVQNGSLLNAVESNATYQWLDCDNGYTAIVGETNQFFTAAITGNYAVEITQGLCTDTSACVLVDFTGVDMVTNFEISLYPNPTSGKFTITADAEITEVEVVDMLGRKIAIEMDIDSGIVETSQLESGKYLVKIQTEKGTAIKELVVIK